MSDNLRRPPIAGVAALAAFAYFVVVGGTPVGEILPAFRVVNSLLGGVLIAYYLLRAPRDGDRFDAWLAVAVGLFAIAGVLSAYPRQSFDAVVGALGYAAAAFVARRLLARREMRRLFVSTLIVLSGAITLTTAMRWLPVIQTWWSVTGTTVPALDLDFPSMPWGHWHNLALLVGLLYPAWWARKPSPFRRVFALVIGLVTFLVVAVDGSRNLWIAFIVATVSVVAPPLIRRVSFTRRGSISASAVIAATFAVSIPTGILAAVLERLTNLSNVGFRLAMWEPLTGAWLSHPLAGFGPGSFPWLLQRTAYFDSNSYAPRHPDSAIFQLLPEAGL